eukprot:3050236-Pleurochrysis_carterae.AAC.1
MQGSGSAHHDIRRTAWSYPERSVRYMSFLAQHASHIVHRQSSTQLCLALFSRSCCSAADWSLVGGDAMPLHFVANGRKRPPPDSIGIKIMTRACAYLSCSRTSIARAARPNNSQ